MDQTPKQSESLLTSDSKSHTKCRTSKNIFFSCTQTNQQHPDPSIMRYRPHFPLAESGYQTLDKILQWNIRGFYCTLHQLKRIIDNPRVISLQETFLKSNQNVNLST